MALSNLKQSPIPTVPRQMKIVNPDGTVTRSGQLLLEQLQASKVFWGAPGDMANASDIQDGTIFVVKDPSSDASELLYQFQQGEWHYIAGTMWGTLSPDQRPVGLGPNDAGFTFRTIDSNPQYGARTFVWSGTVWVETTAARFDTHAARTTGTGEMMNTALWIETDRSNVLYQLQGSIWHYIAGTMWGTISPDQRPTDLGVYDAGFDFRGTDQQREFIWSGTIWVETTSGGTYQIAYGTTTQTLTTTQAALTGATLTLARAGVYAIRGIFDFSVSGAGDYGQLFLGQLQADGTVDASHVALFTNSASASAVFGRVTVGQEWLYTAPAAGKVVALLVSKGGGTGASVCFGTNSMISATWISP